MTPTWSHQRRVTVAHEIFKEGVKVFFPRALPVPAGWHPPLGVPGNARRAHRGLSSAFPASHGLGEGGPRALGTARTGPLRRG